MERVDLDGVQVIEIGNARELVDQFLNGFGNF
jgi:hypothetical protein